ncbi:metal ion binding [Mactra antiquata]
MVRTKNNGGANRSNGPGESGDTLNLLDSSDSDVEWLNLPPLKGKKPKKKRGLKVQRNGDSSLWTFLKIFLVLVIVVAVVLLSITCAWLISQLNDVKESLRQLEVRSSKSSEDVDRLSPDLVNINKTLYRVISDINTVNTTVTQVSGTVIKLSHSVDAAPELKELPGKLQTVSKAMADLGSDVANMKDTFDSVGPFMKSTSDSLDKLEKQIKDIQNKTNSEIPEGREHGSATPDVQNALQVLSQQLLEVNSTLSTQVSVLMKAHGQHEERLNQLESTTHTIVTNMSSLLSSLTSNNNVSPIDNTGVTDDYNSEQFNQSVTAIVQHVMLTDRQTQKVELLIKNITTALASLNEVKDKYEDLESSSNTDTEGIQPSSYVSVEMFDTLGDGFADQISSINSSLDVLKSDVKTMSNLLSHHSTAISNLTHQLDATKYFIKQSLNTGGSNLPTAKPDLSSQVPPNDSVTKTGVTPVGVKQEDTTTKQTTMKSSITVQKSALISIEGIDTFDDLQSKFRNWSMTNGGKEVDYRDLQGFLGPNTPDEDILKSYDTNHNGLYSLDEFAEALGFDIPSTLTTTQSSPPR